MRPDATDALRALASRGYYENGSTTTDPSDDYDYRGLEQLLTDVQNTVKAVKYDIEIEAIEILGERREIVQRRGGIARERAMEGECLVGQRGQLTTSWRRPRGDDEVVHAQRRSRRTRTTSTSSAVRCTPTTRSRVT